MNKLNLLYSNLEDDSEEIQMELIEYSESIISSWFESRDQEMSVIT